MSTNKNFKGEEFVDSLFRNLIFNQKYAQRKENGKLESWSEALQRVYDHYLKVGQKRIKQEAVFDEFKSNLDKAFVAIENNKLLPSMRALAYAGDLIEEENSRIYNCAFLPIDSARSFFETFFLLAKGTGVGFSLMPEYTKQLRVERKVPKIDIRDITKNSLTHWQQENFETVISFCSGIQDKSAEIASNYMKMVEHALSNSNSVLTILILDPKFLTHVHRFVGILIKPKWSTLDIFDMVCIIADQVSLLPVRRSATIALFDKSDDEMLMAKTGDWPTKAPWRSKANISVEMDPRNTTKEEFDKIWNITSSHGYGEPGIFWSEDLLSGTNPCGEIGLRAYEFCNLVEINLAACRDSSDLLEIATLASFLATIQATFTNFKVLNPLWSQHCAQDSLIGVGLTGIASTDYQSFDLDKAAGGVVNWNRYWAKHLGIKPASRCTTVKPSGTTSLLMGTSSGVHPQHSEYYWRGIRIPNSEQETIKRLKTALPSHCFVDEILGDPEACFVRFPRRAPAGSIFRRMDTPDTFLDRVLYLNKHWIARGHADPNCPIRNNVSATASLATKEWKDFGERLWKHRFEYRGISAFPLDENSYQCPPYEECTENDYLECLKHTKRVKLYAGRNCEPQPEGCDACGI